MDLFTSHWDPKIEYNQYLQSPVFDTSQIQDVTSYPHIINFVLTILFLVTVISLYIYIYVFIYI